MCEMDNLTVSVITAVRNGLNEVVRTMDSVREQTFPRLEYVVVDGKSSDGTTQYLRSRHSEIDVFQSQADSGVYDAFNKGLKLATGDIIGYLNAGDVFAHRRSLENIMTRFQDSSVDAVFGDVAMTSRTDLDHVLRKYKSNKFKPERMKYGFMPAHPTLYLRRSIYETVGRYDTSYQIAGDFEFSLRAFLNHRIRFAYIPETLVKMPVGGLSTRGWRSKWRITMEMKTACAKNLIKTNLLLLSLRFPVKAYELVKYRFRSSDE
jgi:glycosyltransferase involved in cell wall biosynthesis